MISAFAAHVAAGFGGRLVHPGSEVGRNDVVLVQDIDDQHLPWLEHAMEQAAAAVVAGTGTPDELQRRLSAAGLTVLFAGLASSSPDRPKDIPLVILDRSGAAPPSAEPPTEFRVVALIHVFNEADVIAETIRALRRDGVDVYVLDNWSTDDSYELAVDAGVIGIERCPAEGPTSVLDGPALHRRTEELARELEASWFVHIGADERRRPPWPGVSLRSALAYVDRAGFNCVDHTCLEFCPIDEGFRAGDDVEDYFRHFEFGSRPGHFVHFTAWKSLGLPVELTASYGHDTQFPGRRPFPYKFLNKHYPIRSTEHGRRKVFEERLPRYLPEEVARGLHSHYQGLEPEHPFVLPAHELRLFDGAAFDRDFLIERLSGIGLHRDPADEPTAPVLGESSEWADGSEQEVLSILRQAQDRSSSSDELAGKIHDWPTRYHFSRLRSKILHPLRVVPGTRVLDLGGGTGPLTRRLAELGAEVVLLDGSAARAEAAAARCEGLEDVSVAVGTVFALDSEDEPFDVVLAVGLLEYTPASPGGPEGLLRKATSLLAPDGVLAVAIENAIGLKYLLGHAEDHVGRPWVGLEGYNGIDHVRTYSRAELASMLASAGLPEQAWFYPFPDYKLPSVIVSDAGYALDEPDVVDAIVPRPCSSDTSAAQLPADPRATHRTMLRAGLGRDLANSFLVIGAKASAGLDTHVDRETLAWLVGSERSTRFMRERRLVSHGSGLAIVDDGAGGEEIEAGWLIQRRHASVPFEHGEPLDLLVSNAFAASDTDRTHELLALWAGTLREQATTAVLGPGVDSDAMSPFHAEDGRLGLPGEYLDSQPANFLYRDGRLHRIDAEWEARGAIDFDLVCVRGLFCLSADLLARGITVRSGAGGDVASLVTRLGEAAGVSDCRRALDRLPAAEAMLQSLVLELPAHSMRASIDRLLASPTRGPTAPDQVERELESLREEIEWRKGVMDVQGEQLTTLQNSRSVRYTSPLRRLAASLRRR
jgi:2-polyprenyl-3-methyl-5-hydroxy-6-metoxy-1,4-benzoquinol methylase